MEIRPILSALLRNKIAPLLVALQVAISLAILANALHIVTQRYQASIRPSGIADEADSFVIEMRPTKKQPLTEVLAQQVLARQALMGTPGVAAAAWVSQVPLMLSGWNSSLAVDRKQVQPTALASLYLSPDPLIDTLGLRLVEGRDFKADDVEEVDFDAADPKSKSVIVTQALARKMYPDASSFVGKTILFGTGSDAPEAQIIGVVERLQTPDAAIKEQGEYSLIRPIRSAIINSAQFIVRTEAGQRDRVMRDVETLMHKVTPYPVIVKTTSLDKARAKRYRDDRTLAWMLVVVSGLLLLVTASGIVGMTSLWVSQRRKQIGVRRALGARRLDILRYFITENLLITTGGVAAGLIMAVALNQFLVSQLEMSKLPIIYLTAGALAFWLLGVLSVYGPAWRAASISPAVATRTA